MNKENDLEFNFDNFYKLHVNLLKYLPKNEKITNFKNLSIFSYKSPSLSDLIDCAINSRDQDLKYNIPNLKEEIENCIWNINLMPKYYKYLSEISSLEVSDLNLQLSTLYFQCKGLPNYK